MNNEEFFAIHEELNVYRDDILGIKGSEYPAGDGDRLSNFKVVGQLVGVEPDVTCLNYLLKHVLSLATFVREHRSDQPEREPIKGRLADIANYCDLMLAIFREEGRA